MMFPFVDSDTVENEQTYYTPREYGMNFETGQLTGKIVEGLEALKVWAYLTLQTAERRYYIYSWEYGHDLESLIGKGYSRDYMATEAERMVRECLTVNPYITDVDNFEFEQKEDHVTLKFMMITDFGDEEVETSV